jgi:hypothetical protein
MGGEFTEAIASLKTGEEAAGAGAAVSLNSEIAELSPRRLAGAAGRAVRRHA